METGLIPWSAEDVDLAFIRRALAPSAPEAADGLRGIEVSPLARQGNAGVVLRVTLQHGEPGASPSSVVVKLPQADRAQRARTAAGGLFESEVRFYRDLAATCPVRTPRCYLAESDPENLRFALVLEDLGDPTSTWPTGRGLPAELARTMIDELAKLHAAFWNAPQLTALTWLRTPKSNVDFWQGVVGAVATHLPDALAFDAPPELPGLLDALNPRLPALAAYLSGPPYTLAHGDFTQRNASLGTDGRPIAFDWQLVQRARGARDVAYLIPFLRPEVTAGSGVVKLLERYHAQLRAHGVDDYPLAELQRDQVIATTEVMQVGLATIAPALAHAATRGERTDAPWIRGLLNDIARGALRLNLIEVLQADFPVSPSSSGA